MNKDFYNLPQDRQSICGHPLAEIVTDREGTSYCAQCEREAQPTQKPWSLRLNAITIAATFILVLVCFTGGMLKFFRPDSRQTAVVAADNVTIISTNTAAPSETPEATHTPYPTFTHTGEPETVYQPSLVTQVVIITTTPQPTYTPFPTWTPRHTATVTDVPLWVQQADQKLEHAMRKAEIKIRFAEWITHPIILTIILIIIALVLWSFNWRRMAAWLDRKTAPVEQTAEEIVQPSEYMHPRYTDWRSRAWFLREKRGLGPSDIVKDLWPDNTSGGGSQFYAVKKVLSVYDPMGEFGPPTPPPHSPAAANGPTTPSSRE